MNMLNILMKVVWVMNIFAQVYLLVNHHLREHEDDQDAARVHWGAFKSTIEIFFPSVYFHLFFPQVEFKGMDIVKHGESAYPAQV